ncbi:MAG: HU family DNA-binding protein [Bacteroidaceae bacterium]|nr:HU family DNA-binding protein [Bacteroidaceae bacterium]
MTKQELIDKVAATGITKAQAKAALEAALDGIKESIVKEGKMQLIGFGTFSVNERPAREGINPATKEKIQIAAKKVVKFKVASAIEAELN